MTCRVLFTLIMTHVLRHPQIDLAAVLTQPNAHIDLRLEVYESSTRNFLKAVANYKNRAITTISARRANQAGENKKVLEKTQSMEADTIQCKLKEIELVAGASHFLVCSTTA
jgi:kinetochore protein Spc25, fungi type